MSRTDKDMPYWVRAEWWQPDHVNCSYAESRRWPFSARARTCSLPDAPVIRGYRRWRPGDGCCWEPVWRWRYYHRGRIGSGVPKWFRDHVWNNPERRRERDLLAGMRREYNAYHEVEEDDFPCWQARHGAHWLWD